MIRCLCAGETRANSVVRSAASASCGVGHPLDVGAEQHHVDDQPDLLADLAGDEVVVARDDLDRDAVAPADRRWPPGRSPWADRGTRRSPGGSASHSSALPYGVAAAADGFAACPSFVAIARTRNPSALRRSYSLLELLDVSVVHRQSAAVELEARAARKDRLGRALGDDAGPRPSGVRTTTDMMRRWKSNGISSTLRELRDRARARGSPRAPAPRDRGRS